MLTFRAASSANETATRAVRLAGAGRGGMRCRTYRGGVARHPAYGETHEQVRERLLAVLAGGTPCPIGGSPMFRHRMPDLHHTDAAGR